MPDTERWGGRRSFLRATGAAGAAAALPVTARSSGPGEQRPRVAVVGLSDPDAVEGIDPELPDSVRVLDRSERLRYVRVALPRGDGAYDRLRVESRVAALDPVKYVEYDEPMPVLAVAGDPTTPSDPRFGQQYALEMVNAPAAWSVIEEVEDRRVDPESVVVGVVDTGVDYEHRDLSGAFDGELGHDAVDRWFWGDPDSDPKNEEVGEFHGTHVAGIVGAVRDNGRGVSGVADVTLRSYRAIGADGFGRPSDVANAIRKAADDGADVINMSLGFPVPLWVVKDAVSYAVEEGTVPVAAAGNIGDAPPSAPEFIKEAWSYVDSPTHVWYPASYDDCLAVSALDEDGSLGGYSKYGDEVDLAAPGTDVLSTMPEGHRYGDYAELRGTSMATPVVAGVAALVRRRYPDLSVAEVRRRLRETAEDVGLPEPKQGAGRVDALAAVSGATFTGEGVTATTYDGDLQRGGQWTDVHDLQTDPEEIEVILSGPDDADLDLYVSVDGSTPTQGDFDRRAWSVGSDERIEIADADRVSALGLLVDAFSDDGQFRVTVVERSESAADEAASLSIDAAAAPGTQAFAVDVPHAGETTWEIDGAVREGAVVAADLDPGEHEIAVAVDGQRASDTLTVTPAARAGHRRRVETHEALVGDEALFRHDPAPDAEQVTVRVAAVDGPADLDLFAAREGQPTPESFDAGATTATDREHVTLADPEGPIDLLVDRVAGETGRVRLEVEELLT